MKRAAPLPPFQFGLTKLSRGGWAWRPRRGAALRPSSPAARPSQGSHRATRGWRWRFLWLALLAPGWLPAEDRVFLKSGRQAECRVLDFTPGALKILYRPAPAAAPTERLVPLGEVDYVELAPLPGEPEALALAVREGRSDPLMAFWVKRLPWLGRPRSNGGEIGLTYAELLTRIATPDRMERALHIYQQIEAGDWSEERRGRAQAGRLRVLLRQGRIAEVRPQAEALLQRGGDCRILMELHHVMAEASAAALAELERDHPQWTQEDDLGPRHQQLLDEALDGYLYGHLFHGAEEDLAARGLWAAAQLACAQQNSIAAADWASDLTQLYAGTPEAAAAETWLEQQAASRPAGPPPKPAHVSPPARSEDSAEPRAAAAEESVKPRRKSKSKPPKPPAPAKEDRADE